MERAFSNIKCIKTILRSGITDWNLELLIITATQGPESLSDEAADYIIDRFLNWPDKERLIALGKPQQD